MESNVYRSNSVRDKNRIGTLTEWTSFTHFGTKSLSNDEKDSNFGSRAIKNDSKCGLFVIHGSSVTATRA